MRTLEEDINRITPADAGKTHFRNLRIALFEDHPRGCGENAGFFVHGIGIIGSPPRMRGKRFEVRTGNERIRITPAGAGKTNRGHGVLHLKRDHPRRCGEN